ncbi:MAG: FAD-binding oxidoreductase [Rhodobacteraceae bacterium]|nr:FAD-binding oxidoreductase [Paracoccaceae bacterium]
MVRRDRAAARAVAASARRDPGDICVIGGGYTGLSAALHLAERGYDVVLVEAHRAGWGASGRNGGQIAVGQRVDQETLEARLGREMAARLWDLGLASVDLVHSLCARHRIDCDYVPGLVDADHRARHVRHTHAYVEKLQRVYGYDRIAPLDRAGCARSSMRRAISAARSIAARAICTR